MIEIEFDVSTLHADNPFINKAYDMLTITKQLPEKGVSSDPDKIKDRPLPRNAKEVKSCLCSYYGRFVLRFASIAKPLDKLSISQTSSYGELSVRQLSSNSNIL